MDWQILTGISTGATAFIVLITAISTWWIRRSKVIVTDPLLEFNLSSTRITKTSDGTVVVKIKIRAEFNLVQTRGTENLYVTEAELKLNRHLHKRFVKYFPPNFPLLSLDMPEAQKLDKHRPCLFIYSKDWYGTEVSTRLLESPVEKNDFNEIVNLMEKDFEIHWKYSHSNRKAGYYRYPPKLWHKVVPVMLRRWGKFSLVRTCFRKMPPPTVINVKYNSTNHETI